MFKLVLTIAALLIALVSAQNYPLNFDKNSNANDNSNVNVNANTMPVGMGYPEYPGAQGGYLGGQGGYPGGQGGYQVPNQIPQNPQIPSFMPDQGFYPNQNQMGYPNRLPNMLPGGLRCY